MRIRVFPILFCLVLVSCGETSEIDTPVSGRINISCDESLMNVFESETETFESLYPDAHIEVSYKPEAELFVDLIQDSSRLIIASRKLNKSEEEYFRKIEIIPHQIKICLDAVALIVNNTSNDTMFTLSELKEILEGKSENINSVGPANMLVVFDNQSSGIVRYIENYFGIKLGKNVFAVKSNREVINYVTKNKNTLGLIGVNWISDKDDEKVKGFLKSVKIVALNNSLLAGSDDEFQKPYQAYIAIKSYPLVREFYIISREARSGLGSGFTAFAAGEKGQRIILKSGLVPATMPVRLVETY